MRKDRYEYLKYPYNIRYKIICFVERFFLILIIILISPILFLWYFMKEIIWVLFIWKNSDFKFSKMYWNKNKEK